MDWLAELKKRHAALEGRFKQLQADANAVLGAIQECDYWIKVLSDLANDELRAKSLETMPHE